MLSNSQLGKSYKQILAISSKHFSQMSAVSAPYRVKQKNLAKFSDTCSVMAVGLRIGSPRLVGRRKAGNSNRQELFLRHPV